MNEEIRLVVEIATPSPDELEAFRRIQIAGIRRFLEAVEANRIRLGLSPLRGTLTVNDPSRKAQKNDPAA